MKDRIVQKLKDKILNKQEGAAMLVAVVVMIVLMMFSLAMLLAAYSLYHSASTQSSVEQVRELAWSLSQRIQDEMTVNFSTKAEEEAARAAGKDQIWFYVRDGIWKEGQTDWPYHNEDEWGHEAASAYRYLNLEMDGQEDADTTVRMSWDSENNVKDKNGTLLTVVVSCGKMSQNCTITSVYELTVSYGYKDKTDYEKWSWTLVERE